KFAEGRDLEAVIAPPDVDRLPEPEQPARRPETDWRDPAPYQPEPVAEWRRPSVRAAFSVAVRAAPPAIEVPAVIGGRRVSTPDVIESVDPGRTDTVIARSASCRAADADAAVEACATAF